MNNKQLQKDAIENRIQEIKRLNHMMERITGCMLINLVGML